MQDTITVIVPCYNAERELKKFCEVFSKVAEQMNKDNNVLTECILINDGSTDGTWQEIVKLTQGSSNTMFIRGMNMSKGTGWDKMVLAGMERGTGEYTTILDVRKPNMSHKLLEMYRLLKGGAYDSTAVYVVRDYARTPMQLSIERSYYKMINKLSDTEVVAGASKCWMVTKRVKESILSLRGKERIGVSTFERVGYRTKWLAYNEKRSESEDTGILSKGYWRSKAEELQYINKLDIKPLLVSSVIGMLIVPLSFIEATLGFGVMLTGGNTFVSSIILVSMLIYMCIQMGILSCIGIYLLKMYKQDDKEQSYVLIEDTIEMSEGAEVKANTFEDTQVFDALAMAELKQVGYGTVEETLLFPALTEKIVKEVTHCSGDTIVLPYENLKKLKSRLITDTQRINKAELQGADSLMY